MNCAMPFCNGKVLKINNNYKCSICGYTYTNFEKDLSIHFIYEPYENPMTNQTLLYHGGIYNFEYCMIKLIYEDGCLYTIDMLGNKSIVKESLLDGEKYLLGIQCKEGLVEGIYKEFNCKDGIDNQ